MNRNWLMGITLLLFTLTRIYLILWQFINSNNLTVHVVNAITTLSVMLIIAQSLYFPLKRYHQLIYILGLISIISLLSSSILLPLITSLVTS